MDLESLKYPIGHYKYDTADEETIRKWISDIELLPGKVKELVGDLSNESLESRYRPNGWTIKQVVHHLADSHMNSFIRFKLLQTEETPTIRSYSEADWAETVDAKQVEVEHSLKILDGLHKRWTVFLKAREASDWSRICIHPEYTEPKRMNWMLGLYAWHCRHHLAHIEQAIANQGKFD